MDDIPGIHRVEDRRLNDGYDAERLWFRQQSLQPASDKRSNSTLHLHCNTVLQSDITMRQRHIFIATQSYNPISR